MKLLMITGDRALAQGKKGPFYYTLEEFSKYWERIDVICPKIQNSELKTQNLFGNVFIHSSSWPLIFQPLFISKKGAEIFREQKFDLFTIHSYPPFYNDIGGLWLYNKLRTSPASSASQTFPTPQTSQTPLTSCTSPTIPYVLEVHHITGCPRAGDFREKLYSILTRIFIKKFARNATAVRVVNQKQTPEFLIKFGIDKEKIKYISSAYIDLETFKPMSMEKKYDIVFAGRLTKNKGTMLLLEAIKKINNQKPNIKMIIVGTGPLENKIKKFIKQNQLENNIEFAGWLPGMEDVAKAYNQSKIFVMPSFNEGGPRVNLEAMACNVAVITSRVGLMIDIIKDKENGLFVDWDSKDIADKIMLLLEDDDLCKKIAENGYKIVQQFERKKMIKNYAETYQNLLHSSGI